MLFLSSGFPKTKITWTRTKTDLVELIYAVCEADCFNFGKANLKQIVSYFENIFNVDLGNPYHTYIEIRERANRTQFLNELKEILIRKMNDNDNKHFTSDTTFLFSLFMRTLHVISCM